MKRPFAERGGRLRGGLDLMAGRLPGFIFGGSVGDLLPIFHFHDEPRSDLEAKFRYLAENGYRTVSGDDMAAFAGGAQPIPARAVALCFDDAWASVWSNAGPLLATYGLTAIVYAIPGRTLDAASVRRPDQMPPESSSLFMTWPELRALQTSGVIDVQSHTFSHAMVDTSDTPIGFIDETYASSSLLGRPLIDESSEASSARRRLTFASPADLGAPLYPTRSGMSDAPRVIHASSVRDSCLRLVRDGQGAAFFATEGWRDRLLATAQQANGTSHFESPSEHQRRIEGELDDARAELETRLDAKIRHVCLPWGVSGRVTEAALKRLGFSTAIANRMSGVFALRRGDDPYWLKRLPNRYIYRLPGAGRRWWFLAR